MQFIRIPSGIVWGLLVALIAAILHNAAYVQAAVRPNIVLIMADDLGFSDLGCYGGEIATPNLDRLARSGLRFTQFYNNAICEATRISLLSGLYPQQVGGKNLHNCVTLAEVLRTANYRTLMAGKWHLEGQPRQRGFDRFYGLLTGCCNHFNPGLQRPGERQPGKKFPGDEQPFAIDDMVMQPYTPDDNFYSTDTFTDYALEFLDEHRTNGQPFFLYVAYTVPHYPLHAWPEDIAKYRGKYLLGWDALRQQRYERLVQMGLIEAEWGLSPRSPYAPEWQEVEDQDAWDLKMAVYAAMVDRMDQNIGRILGKIRELGQEQNTLVLFLSDNGGSDEDRTSTPSLPPGPAESYRTVDLPWANFSNTPFQHFKRWNHEGGISAPLIAYWPKVITRSGAIEHEIGHVIDIMATCIDVSGAQYPATYNQQKIPALEGRSLLPTLQSKQRQAHEALFWNQEGLWRAVRMGKWKLVSPDMSVQYKPWRPDQNDRITRANPEAGAVVDPETLWELYDMDSDRTELRDLAQRYPERVQEMAAMYRSWDQRMQDAPSVVE